MVFKNVYLTNIEKKTLNNTNFREVLFTGPHSQLVIMSLKPNEEIGEETHASVDQFIRIEAGDGIAILNDKKHILKDGSSLVIPAKTKHNIVNKSDDKPLKLYTIYSPPEHEDGIIHKTKEDALKEHKSKVRKDAWAKFSMRYK